jgi:hypothetical protein
LIGWGHRSGGLESLCIEVGDTDVRAEAHEGSQVLPTPRPIPCACPTPLSLVINAGPVSGFKPTEPRRSDAICRVEGDGSRRRRARGSALVTESLRVPAVTTRRSRHTAWYRDCVSDDTDRTGQRGEGPHEQHALVLRRREAGDPARNDPRRISRPIQARARRLVPGDPTDPGERGPSRWRARQSRRASG